MMKKILFISLLIIFGASSRAQIGTEFWFAAPDLAQNHAQKPIRFCMVSYDEPATVTFSQPANQGGYEPHTFNLEANSFEIYDVSSIVDIVETQPCNTVVNYGFRITSDTPISVYYESNNNNSEIYSLKGPNALGKDFIVATQYTCRNSFSVHSRAEIVAVYDNTKVTIVPSVALKGDIPAGQTVVVTLNRGQAYAVEALGDQPSDHIRGTRITSNKPIAVNTSDDSVLYNLSRDLVGEQLVPSEMLGIHYIAVKSGTDSVSDRLYFFPIEDNTDIYINGNSTPLASLNIGEEYVYVMDEPVANVTSNHPISVFQFTVDPEESGGTVLPQMRCTGSKKIACLRPAISGNSKHMVVTIVAKTNYIDGFKVNDDTSIITASDFSQVPSAPEYSYCKKNVSNYIPENTVMRIENTYENGYFHLGVLSASSSTCTYGYFSNYSVFSDIEFVIDETDYCAGSTVVFDYTGTNVSDVELFGPNDLHTTELPFTITNITTNEAGMYYIRGIDEVGCFDGYVMDSVEITVHENPSQSYISDEICFGKRYQNYGFDTTNLAVGVHPLTRSMPSTFGCDSIVNLTLTVNPTYDTTFVDTICKNELPYQLHGFDLDSLPVGKHYDTIKEETVLGCDSIVYLELYVAPVYDTTFADTICENEQPYQLHGFNLDNLPVGMHFDSLNPGTIYGCDSITHLELYVAPVYDTTFVDTICKNELPYQLHGFNLDNLPVGMHFDSINPGTIYGCDSTVRLELYVAPVYDTTFNEHICFGNPYQEHGFDLDSLPVGMHYDTIDSETVLGCDSIVYLELYVAPLYDTLFQDTACINEGYHMHGFELDSLELGWNYGTQFLSSIHGCDSTVMLELFVAPIFDTTFHDTICYGYGYHQHGFDIDSLSLAVGMNYYNINPGTILGCDSIVYLELYVAPVYDINIYDSICFGEDYNHYNFDTVAPAPGLCLMQQELVTGIGCDSIVTLELFVGEVYDITIHDTICYGNDYDKYNFHLVNPPVGDNSETQSLSTMYSCDSIVNLNLYVAPVYSFNVVDSICEGEDYDNYGLFIPQPAPGVYNVVSALETELGCDSIFNVNFKVIYSFATPDTIYGPQHVFFSTDMLAGKYKYYIDSIPGCEEYHWEIDNDDWQISADSNKCVITVTTPDVATLTVWAGNSCGSVSKSIEITAGYFGVDENGGIDVSVYPNPSKGYLNVEGNGVEAVNVLNAMGVVVRKLKYNYDDNVTIDISDLPNALYVLEIVTRDGKCMRRVTKY